MINILGIEKRKIYAIVEYNDKYLTKDYKKAIYIFNTKQEYDETIKNFVSKIIQAQCYWKTLYIEEK